MLFIFIYRREQLINKEKCASLDGLSRIPTRRLKRSNTTGSPRSMRNNKLNMGEARDDVHVCIMCLRAIMNHQVCTYHGYISTFIFEKGDTMVCGSDEYLFVILSSIRYMLASWS